MISPLAYIDPEAKIGENVEIGPFAVSYTHLTLPTKLEV